jgi:hypothetical protein
VRKVVAFIGAVVVAAPGMAATDTRFSMTAQAGVGYDSNPFLNENAKGSLTGDITLSPQIDWVTPTSSTKLSGQVNRVEYLKNYDASRSYDATLTRNQQFNEKLSGNAQIGFSDSTTALLEPGEDDFGTSSNNRRRQYSGSGSLSYQPDARNSFTTGANYQKAQYPGEDSGLNDYDSYGGSFGYSRVISDRTTVGVTLGVSQMNSKNNPDSTSYQPQITLKHAFNSAWSLDAAVGIIFQRTKFGGATDSTRNLGLQLDLCGTYPRQSICIGASRDSSASGYGGPRIRSEAHVNYSYQLNERSRITANGTYTTDKSSSFAFVADKIEYARASAGYERDLTQRLSVGALADYSWRSFSGSSSSNSIAGSAYLRMKFGRTQ